ncbi:hypothetical protein ACSNOI_48150, partial [Actinomadura kijaniata]|uniref:hypothetical protein n=1 Tax=Actinomadura kijaniata TaxID=46161 RepID=UPI003F1A790D
MGPAALPGSVPGPGSGEHPDLRLRGFLFTGRDRLRLYLDAAEAPVAAGATDAPGRPLAAEIRLTGAVTALLAALPSLLRED